MQQVLLDNRDRRILGLLQTAPEITAAEIGERIGASQATCWRRIRRLREEGLIPDQVVTLDRKKAGFNVMVFAQVKLNSQGRADLASFAEAIQSFPEVLECYVLMGSVDFLLRAWSVPVGMEIVILLGCGVTIAFGAYFLSQAYRVAQPAVVAPFEYGALPLSLFWGVMLWGHWPDATAMAGMTLIVGSGLYVFYRETMQGRRLTVRRFLPRNR